MMAAGMRYLAVPWSHLVVSVLSAGWCHARDSRSYCAWSRASWTGPEQRRARRRGVHAAVQCKPGPSAVNRGERAPTRRSARHHPDPAKAPSAMTETDITRLCRGPGHIPYIWCPGDASPAGPSIRGTPQCPAGRRVALCCVLCWMAARGVGRASGGRWWLARLGRRGLWAVREAAAAAIVR